MSSPWDELDAKRREHDELVDWLRKDHGGWTLQPTDGAGYIARRRASKDRPSVVVRGRNISLLQQAILDEEARES